MMKLTLLLMLILSSSAHGHFSHQVEFNECSIQLDSTYTKIELDERLEFAKVQGLFEQRVTVYSNSALINEYVELGTDKIFEDSYNDVTISIYREKHRKFRNDIFLIQHNNIYIEFYFFDESSIREFLSGCLDKSFLETAFKVYEKVKTTK